MGISCENCGRENEDGFKFCLGCGSALNSPKKQAKQKEPVMNDCPECGTQVPDGFKFCGACGASLEDTGSASQSREATGKKRQVGAASPAESSGESLGELTVIRPDGTEGARIPVTKGGTQLGRDSDFEVLANDPFLAPKHAEIRHEGGGLKLESLDEVNGVFWRLRDDVELQNGDLLRIGQELLRFEMFSKVEPLNGTNGGQDAALPKGSPNPGIWARLALVSGPDLETRAFVISSDDVTIGRELGAILFRDDGFVSGKHARIYRDEGKVFLRDLGSSNGSYIRIRKKRSLSNGDLILMGQQLLRVTIG